ncbi:hypothetical protein [Shewanella sp. Pdp11]|nr:hypothetical protein [Shewanella sp. Pdp11]
MDEAQISAITGAVDFATIIVGIGAVAAASVIVYVSIKGARMLLGMVRGA